jgi:hypothetical protein
LFLVAESRTQGLMPAKQMLYHWVSPQAQSRILNLIWAQDTFEVLVSYGSCSPQLPKFYLCRC